MEYILGGLGIGFGISILILFNGKVLGVSGILRGFLQNPVAENGWRFSLILGLVLSPLLYQLFFDLNPFEILSSPLLLIAAGFLVGLGASLSNGCTSGHSVCGVSRLSPRSILATLVMMGFAFVTFNVLKFIL